MKEITITCDTCGKHIDENHISIGRGGGNDLSCRNQTNFTHVTYGRKRYLSSFRDLHFCSQEHFIKYFFGGN